MTNKTPEQREWRCFQCGELFIIEKLAAAHFGVWPHMPPGCVDRLTPAETEVRVRHYEAQAAEHRAFLIKHNLETRLREAEAKVREAEANALRRAAELADTFGETILCMWDRPGGPPGNGYAPLRGSHVASAIRSLLPKEEGQAPDAPR